MKKFLKIVSVVAALTLCFRTSVFADNYHTLYTSPEYDNEIDMVFSVAKGDTDDQTTNGIQYDGKPYGLYDQVHENVNGSGNNGRYSLTVSGGAVQTVINNYYDGARNVNEDVISTDEVLYIVEEILQSCPGIDYDEICDIAAKYISANRDLEYGNYNETWFINWYVLKYQLDGYNPSTNNYGRIHVDGRVIVEPEPEPEDELTIDEPVDEPTEDEPTYEEPVIDEPIVDPPIYYYYYEPEPQLEPTFVPFEVEPLPEPEPTKEEVIETIPVIETPESAPVIEEEVIDDLDDFITPESAPEIDEEEFEDEEIEEVVEEEVEIDFTETPQGLPQTGTASNVLFYSVGGLLVLFGSMLIRKRK